jgi:hypothetical protein
VASNGEIVDVVHRRQARRLARLAFVVTVTVGTPTLTMVVAVVAGPWRGVAVGIAAGIVLATVAAVVALVWPVLRMVWWWAGELLALAALLGGWLGLSRLLPPLVAAGVLAAVVGGLLAVPATRRLVVAWVWCAISRHRLRTCFATFVRVNRRGSLPLILLAWPTAAGERVWVMLRPGLALEDLTTEGGLARLAVGCWAHEVRVSRAFGRFAPLVRVDITRRNPLTGVISSPLTSLLPDPDAEFDVVDVDTSAARSTATPEWDGYGLDLPDVPDPDALTRAGVSALVRACPVTPAVTTGAARPPAKTASPVTPPGQPTVVGRGGEDITDWL